MSDECRLRAANSIHGVHCDGPDCTFWRLVDHLALVEAVDRDGCAIQHFELLDGGQEIAGWLLSVKSRMDAGDRMPYASDPDAYATADA
ncbi:MAG: hypothetical protein Q7W30_04110 [Coriobacteriia bacterium]|nr:hypothetical protein [Coriobacteriia bacterium]